MKHKLGILLTVALFLAFFAGAPLIDGQTTFFMWETICVGVAAGLDPIFSTIPSTFCFASGASGWRTDLYINPDGTFSGYFYDNDMGDVGGGYPKGTRYECNFTGKFTVYQQISEYEYSLKLGLVNLMKAAGQTTIIDGVRVITTDPYGLDNAHEFRLYLPDRKTADLPEPFLEWMRRPLAWYETETLQVFGLYNVGGEQGFYAKAGNGGFTAQAAAPAPDLSSMCATNSPLYALGMHQRFFR